MNRYCLPSKITSQVINDLHLHHMHLGVDGIVRQAQKCVWMPGLHAAVGRELVKFFGCMQKHKIQKDVRIEHCFHMKEKGFASQVVHLDLAGLLPESKEGYKYILGLADLFSAFVMAIAIKDKSHEEVMEAFINNWMYRIGPPEVLVSDNEFVSQEVQRMCRAFNVRHEPTLTYNPRSNG